MVFLKVLKLPKLLAISAKASSDTPCVIKLRLAPKAPAPLVEVPTPRFSWMLSTEEVKSGRLTQKVPWDSESLNGIPLMVTFTREASLPRTRIPVYPIPAPASLVVTTPGKKLRSIGKSWPKLRSFKASVCTSEKVRGWFSLTRNPETLTSSRLIKGLIKLSVSCFCCCAIREVVPNSKDQSIQGNFIRKNIFHE